MAKSSLWVMIAPIFVWGSALAQHAGHMDGQGGIPSQELLERPVSLRSEIGVTHQKISTTFPAAQAYYDQGLSYLHSFVWVESIRSFHQALRSDPNLAMAYVGMADAYIGLQDIAAAHAACKQAQALAGHMSDGERNWLTIRTAEIESVESGSDPEKYAIYRQAVDSAIEANPKDAWLWVQGGLATESSPLTHGQASGTGAVPFYQHALSIDPKNLAALHYIVHANENLGQTREALDGSAVYAKMAPAIPHAHHMHGHELMRVGKSEEAIQEFLAARALEESYHRRERVPAGLDWHYAHNLQLLALNYELLGEMKVAANLLHQAFELPASTEFLDYNRKAWPEFLINRGRYEEALQAALELANSPSPMPRLAGHSLMGQALLDLDRIDEAQQQLGLADKEAASLLPQVAAALPYPAALHAALLLRQARTRQGEEIYVAVEKAAIAMPGPDGWIASIFALESIAKQAREAGDWELASYTAQQLIQQDPYYAGGHFALGLAVDHAGESGGAVPMFTHAQELWVHADQDLPELKETRVRLSTVR